MEILSMAKSKKTEQATAPAEEAVAQDTAQPAPQPTEGLQLTDLRVMMQILDVVTARGAIRADEMTAVGTLYGKLKAFVDQTTQAAPDLSNQGPVDSEGGQPD